MSYISDYKHGYMDEEEFRQCAAEENMEKEMATHSSVLA